MCLVYGGSLTSRHPPPPRSTAPPRCALSTRLDTEVRDSSPGTATVWQPSRWRPSRRSGRPCAQSSRARWPPSGTFAPPGNAVSSPAGPHIQAHQPLSIRLRVPLQVRFWPAWKESLRYTSRHTDPTLCSDSPILTKKFKKRSSHNRFLKSCPKSRKSRRTKCCRCRSAWKPRCPPS